MSIKVLVVLLIALVGVAYTCSCARMNYKTEMCNNRYKYIIKVKITRIVDEKKETVPDYELPEDSTATTMTTSRTITYPWSQKRTVKAVISHFYKGKGKVGSQTLLSSGMMDSMCGMGEWLLPDRRFVLATNDLSRSELGLCGFNFMVGGWEWETVEPILKNHDCGCKPTECRLREGRRVLRGMCHDTSAYCTRDTDRRGSCRWKNAHSIDRCRSRTSYRGYSHS